MAQAALIRVDTQSGLLNYVAYQCHFFLHKDALDDPEKIKKKKLAKKKTLVCYCFNCCYGIFVMQLPRCTHTPYVRTAEHVVFAKRCFSLALCNYVFK